MLLVRASGRVRRLLADRVGLAVAFLLVHVVLGAIDLLDTTHQPMGDVTGVYRFWIDSWHATGQLVGVDTAWVYPIGALLPMLLAGVAGDAAYGLLWLLLVTLLDAVALTMLARRSVPLAWWWTAATLCLGPVALARIDSIALPVAVVAVLFVASRPAVASVLLTVGAWIKVWPAALLVAMLVAGRRSAAVVAAAAITSAAVIAAALLAGSGSRVFSFIAAQTGRGLQIEAPVTSVWLWDGALGIDGTTVYYDREILTYQVTGDGVAATAAIMTGVLVLGALVVCALGVLARSRRVEAQEVLALTGLGLVAAVVALNKVGSPQYLTWFIAPVLLGLLVAPARFRFPAALVLVLAALTQAIYPWCYDRVIGLDPAVLVVLDVRNVLEIVLLAWTAHALATARGVPTPAGREPARTADLG